MVLPPSHKIPRVSCYSGYRPLRLNFGYRAITFFGGGFQSALLLVSISITSVHTPISIAADRFRLFRVRSPLLAESHFVFSSWGYLDVSVPPVSLHHAMDLRNDDSTLLLSGFPIRKSADHWLFAPTRSLSQLVTSFIVSQCQGILPALLVA